MLFSEDRLLAEATGNPPLPYMSILLAAWRGQETEISDLCEREIESLKTAKLGRVAAFVCYAKSVLSNGLGQHEDALIYARRVFDADHIGLGAFAVTELIEAAAHTGDTATLRAALGWMTDRASSCPTNWALGIEARLHALLGEDADYWHRRSIEHLSRAGSAHRGRTRPFVVRRVAATSRAPGRRPASTPHRPRDPRLDRDGRISLIVRVGSCWQLAKKHVSARWRPPPRALTSQELHVALLARDGLSNIEIGTRLFISPRTAQYHLGKVFAKLGIHSRGELSHVLDKRGHN